MRLAVFLAALVTAANVAATTLVVPVYSYNVDGYNGNSWSSELYLTNPSRHPVQVTLSAVLHGSVVKPAPCDLFMSPTRVVPPRSAVLWTANGLATDLGCAETAVGALELKADGPVHVTSRLVNHEVIKESPNLGVLSGRGQDVVAIPVEQLPQAGRHLLPSLIWHRNPCGETAFDTSIGFANPGQEPIRVELAVDPKLAAEGVLVNDLEVPFPHSLTVAPRSWRQLRLQPKGDESPDHCLEPESFVLEVEIAAPLAIYASVVDRTTQDPRTVYSVPIQP